MSALSRAKDSKNCCFWSSQKTPSLSFRARKLPNEYKNMFFNSKESHEGMKDFAEKQKAEHVRLISGQGF